MTQDQLPTIEPGFYEHVEHGGLVQFMGVASSKDAPPGYRAIANYRPLNPKAFVYMQGKKWDFKSVEDFRKRYRLITNRERIEHCEDVVRELYGEGRP